jgi:hypothetical protein
MTRMREIAKPATGSLELPDAAVRCSNGYVARFTLQCRASAPASKGDTGYLYRALSPRGWPRTRASRSVLSCRQGQLVRRDSPVGATRIRADELARRSPRARRSCRRPARAGSLRPEPVQEGSMPNNGGNDAVPMCPMGVTRTSGSSCPENKS